MEWIKKHKQDILDGLLFLLFASLGFILCYVIRYINCDAIWSYGFSYNIYSGLTIYKDFNVLQMPLYFLINSIFLRILGPYFISGCVLNAIMIGFIFMLLYKMIHWKALFIIPILIFCIPSPYNLMCLFLLLCILYLLQEDRYEGLIALLVGLLFITKQNIGIALLIPMIFYSKKKGKSLLLFLLPFALLSIYLLVKGAFVQFIDYCFLGLFDFQGNNTDLLSHPILFFGEIGIGIGLVIALLKSKFQNKEVFYVLMFQMMLYPLVNADHFFVSFIPVLYLIFKNHSKKFYIYPIWTWIFLFCMVFYFAHVGHVHWEKDMFFLKTPDEYIPLTEEIYDYFGGNLHNVYGDSEHIYFAKLFYQEPIGNYDLMLTGNLGGNKEKIIQQLDQKCQEEGCQFLMVKSQDTTVSQFSYFDQYVQSHYEKVDEFSLFDVYSSKR